MKSRRWRKLSIALHILAWLIAEGIKETLDERMRSKAAPGMCSRPHRCRFDGPCNGYPRRVLFRQY